MNGYVTSGYLDQKFDLPVALPTTLLKREDWISIVTLKVQPPMSIQFSELQLHVSSLVVDPTVASGLIANSRGQVYVAIFKDYVQNDPSVLVPQGSSVDTIIAQDVGVWARESDSALLLTPTAVSTYSVVLVNNTRNVDAYVSVTGQLRLALV